MNDEIQTPSTKPDSAASVLSAGLGTLTDAELADFGAALHKERRCREEAGYRARDVCPECAGCGYDGNEMAGHTPCSRCDTSGKYVPNAVGQQEAACGRSAGPEC